MSANSNPQPTSKHQDRLDEDWKKYYNPWVGQLDKHNFSEGYKTAFKGHPKKYCQLFRIHGIAWQDGWEYGKVYREELEALKNEHALNIDI